MTEFIGHSKGSLILTNALIELDRQQEAQKGPTEEEYGQYLTTAYHGAATNIGMAIYSNDQLGSIFKGMKNDRGDLVGTILGQNTANPVDLSLSLLSALRLLGGSSNFLKNIPVIGDIPLFSAQVDSKFVSPPGSFMDSLNESPHTLYTRMPEDKSAFDTLIEIPFFTIP